MGSNGETDKCTAGKTNNPIKKENPLALTAAWAAWQQQGLAFQILLGATARSLISGIRDGGLKSPPPSPSPPLCSLMISKRHRYSPIFRMKSGPSNDDGASRAGWRIDGEFYQWISTISSSHLSIHSVPSHDVARPPAVWLAGHECGAPRRRSLCLSPFRPTHPLELIQIPMSHATTANQACWRVGSRNFLGSVI